MSDKVPTFDPSNFSIEPYVKRLEKPWGYELHWVREDAPYMAKVLHVDAGKRFSLQMHDKKLESWFLMSGKALLILEDNTGKMAEIDMQAGTGYSTQIGQKHRMKAITDCDVLEVSTPEAGTTWRLDDDYKRPDQTPEERESEYAKNTKV